MFFSHDRIRQIGGEDDTNQTPRGSGRFSTIHIGIAASVGIGLAVGIALSVGLNKLLERWAEGSPGDPLILLGVAALLAITSAAACFFPARRASTVDPMIALRH